MFGRKDVVEHNLAFLLNQKRIAKCSKPGLHYYKMPWYSLKIKCVWCKQTIKQTIDKEMKELSSPWYLRK